MSKIKPTAHGKRGRIIHTDAGREISHEELVYGLVKRTAVEVVTEGFCACGTPLPKRSRGPKAVRCDICEVERRRATARKDCSGSKGRYRKSTAQTLATAERIRANRREWAKRKREEVKAKGLCRFCGKNPATGARCEPCKTKRKTPTPRQTKASNEECRVVLEMVVMRLSKWQDDEKASRLLEEVVQQIPTLKNVVEGQM